MAALRWARATSARASRMDKSSRAGDPIGAPEKPRRSPVEAPEKPRRSPGEAPEKPRCNMRPWLQVLPYVSPGWALGEAHSQTWPLRVISEILSVFGLGRFSSVLACKRERVVQ